MRLSYLNSILDHYILYLSYLTYYCNNHGKSANFRTGSEALIITSVLFKIIYFILLNYIQLFEINIRKKKAS